MCLFGCVYVCVRVCARVRLRARVRVRARARVRVDLDSRGIIACVTIYRTTLVSICLVNGIRFLFLNTSITVPTSSLYPVLV